MDVLAHALWVGAGVMIARRRWAISSRAATATVALAVAPDVPHLLPIVGWSVFGSGSAATVRGYAIAAPGQEPALPFWVEWLSHNLHCVTHSAIAAGVVTLLLWLWTRQLWIPLLGWWSHVVIDVFTHSNDYYPSPVLWPITREGLDGLAWNSPGFMAANYAALAAAYLWLLRRRRREREAGRA
ncbi:metal-dependent hydrolase [Sphaerotilus sp.]|uniref:metal-dependent hydrolase n=1 Tax=Sphaerotilus sp. TaxID=2093942 RepID=UPI002ACEB334|nr:metal-dependent hydrolase [Sphaerotilus sp.]MDZ7855764.1 metal-dependent hydrolase [Sphaerotilus sp.]